MMKEILYEFYGDYYEVFDRLRKVKIDSKQITKDYGSHAAFELNASCPIVVKSGGSSLDILADDLGFESSDDLYNHIMCYVPKKKRIRQLEHEFMLDNDQEIW